MKEAGQQLLKQPTYISVAVRALLVSAPVNHTAAVAPPPTSTASALLEDKNAPLMLWRAKFVVTFIHFR